MDWPLLPSQLYPSRNDFQRPLRQQRYTILISIATAASMSFTIFFAYNSSLELPVAPDLIFERPERTILVLNVASQITIFLLAELISATLEAARWAFACSASGASAYTFLALSRATNLVGVLCLLGGHGPQPKKFERDGHRLWGSQR
jgi:hypothetical protein